MKSALKIPRCKQCFAAIQIPMKIPKQSERTGTVARFHCANCGANNNYTVAELNREEYYRSI